MHSCFRSLQRSRVTLGNRRSKISFLQITLRRIQRIPSVGERRAHYFVNSLGFPTFIASFVYLFSDDRDGHRAIYRMASSSCEVSEGEEKLENYDEDEEKSCPFCNFFVQSPCKDSFKPWHACIKRSEEATDCMVPFHPLKACMDENNMMMDQGGDDDGEGTDNDEENRGDSGNRLSSLRSKKAQHS